MKTKLNSSLILLWIIMLIVPGLGMAQAEEQGNNAKGCRVLMKAFKESTVVPQMQLWKEKIDAALTAEDLAELNKLRAEAEKHKQDAEQSRDSLKSVISRIREDYEPEEARKLIKEAIRNHRKNQRSANRDDMRLIMEQLKELMSDYEEVLKELAQEVKSKHAEWSEQKHEIMKECLGADSSVQRRKGKGRFHKKHAMKHGNYGFGPGHEGHGKRKNVDPERRNRFEMAKIILWNGQDPEPEEGAMQLMGVESNGYVTEYNNSPNPFSSTTSINFEVSDQTNATISIYNQTGQLIKTLYDGPLGRGSHEFAFDGSSLNSGVYVYEIKTNEETITGQMVLSK